MPYDVRAKYTSTACLRDAHKTDELLTKSHTFGMLSFADRVSKISAAICQISAVSDRSEDSQMDHLRGRGWTRLAVRSC